MWYSLMVDSNYLRHLSRQLLEMFHEPGSVSFSSKVGTTTCSATVGLEVGGLTLEFRGRGRSKDKAVLAACKMALKHFKA